MSTQAGLVTVAEFLRLPDPKEGKYELRHGEVVLVPPPKWGHHRIQSRVQVLIKAQTGQNGVVWIEMPFRPGTEHEFWTADVGFVVAERAEAVADDEYLSGAPDLVVEVLSPSNTAVEINDRRNICMANGCRSFWVVDPKNRILSVTEGDITRHYGSDASFHCDVLGATVSVREIFE